MAQDGKIPNIQTVKPKLDPDQVIAQSDSEITDEKSAEAEGGDGRSYDIDEGLKAIHGGNEDENEMETRPVDQVAKDIIDDDNEELVEEANRVG